MFSFSNPIQILLGSAKTALSSVAHWICGRVQGSGHYTHDVHLFWAPPIGKHSARFHRMLKITLKVGILCTRKVKPGSAWWHPQGQKALRNGKGRLPSSISTGPKCPPSHPRRMANLLYPHRIKKQACSLLLHIWIFPLTWRD